jgi:SNF2 family DNA or RNA helicase
VIIELSSAGLTITDEDNSLSSVHSSQLQFWGFQKTAAQPCQFRLKTTECRQTLGKLIEYFNGERLPYTLGPNCKIEASKLQTELAELVRVREAGKSIKAGKFNTKKFAEFSSVLQRNIKRSLKEHQFRAAYHLHLTQNGANFSVPGSGKTSVVLALYEKLRNEGKVNGLYVVGPASCFGPWRTEFLETLGRKPSAIILAGGGKISRKAEYFKPNEHLAELYLSTFQTLTNDQAEVKFLFQRTGMNLFLVIDEAHYIKQIGGNWSSAAIELARFAKYRCILTGTPCPHSFADLFNLFEFLWPSNDPIGPENRIRIRTAEQEGEIETAQQILKKTIGPMFYRVTKADLGLTRPIFHPPIVIPMNEQEQFVYDAITLKIRNSAKFDYSKNADVLTKLRRARILRLRQCSAYVGLLTKPLSDCDVDVAKSSELFEIIRTYDQLETPAKIIQLEKLISKILSRKEKVVVWCNFIGALKLIQKHFRKLKVNCEVLYGETPVEQTSIEQGETRERLINRFKDVESGLDVLIANPGACAESISLHKTCHHAIYYDLSYNCAQYLQSLDRIHRVGGSETQEAYYYFLQNKNAIDRDVMENIDRKVQKMFGVLEDKLPQPDLVGDENQEEIQAYERLFKAD